MKKFTIYPAIDLRNGKVVRLKQGKPDKQKIYSNDAVKIAKSWIDAGAKWLHLVNLDSAFGEEASENWNAINKIVETNKENISIQIGGGIRDLNTIEKILNSGIDRVILGTSIIENIDFAKQAVKKFGGEKIVFGLDAKNGILMTHGWKSNSGLLVNDFIKQISNFGAKRIIYTNIETDGMGIGNDIDTTIEIATLSGMEVIASGGIGSLEDVMKVKSSGLKGLIIGRALYENKFSLEEALNC